MSVRILQSYRIAVVVILSSLIVLTVARVSMAQRQQAAVETGVNDQLITKFHGTEYLLANGAFAAAGKSFVIATITDAAGDAFHDFVPDGSDVTQTRDIIQTATCQTCQTCHGEYEFHGHEGERHQVQTCVTCHNPGQVDPHSGESLDMKVLVHKIHAGAELATIR